MKQSLYYTILKQEREGKMKISKESLHTGKINTMELPISEEQFQEGIKLYEQGINIKCAFPMLTNYQRDFIATGMTISEWEELTGE